MHVYVRTYVKRIRRGLHFRQREKEKERERDSRVGRTPRYLSLVLRVPFGLHFGPPGGLQPVRANWGSVTGKIFERSQARMQTIAGQRVPLLILSLIGWQRIYTLFVSQLQIRPESTGGCVSPIPVPLLPRFRGSDLWRGGPVPR